jgi:hypothetical protein
MMAQIAREQAAQATRERLELEQQNLLMQQQMDYMRSCMQSHPAKEGSQEQQPAQPTGELHSFVLGHAVVDKETG